MFWLPFMFSILSPLLIFIIFIFIFSLIAMRKPSSSWFNLLKLYFSIISIVGILGTVIAAGVAWYSWLRQVFITDEEYITGRNAREVQQCDEPTYLPEPIMVKEANTLPNSKIKKKTPEEIKACKDKATQRLVLQRHLDTKESIIWGLVRGVIFLLLFLSHYPRMVKQHQAEKATTQNNKKTTVPKKKKIAKK